MTVARYFLSIISLLLVQATSHAQDPIPLKSDFQIPELFTDYDLNSYGFSISATGVEKYKIFEDEKFKIYWPKLGQFSPTPEEIGCGGLMTILIKRHPLERYTTDTFWSEFSASFEPLLRANCSELPPSNGYNKDPASAFNLKFYYEGFAFENGKMNYSPGVLPGNYAKTPVVAYASFYLYLVPLQSNEIVIQLTRRKPGMKSPEKGPFIATNALDHYHSIRIGFDEPGFPNFEFTNAFAYSLELGRYFKNKREAKNQLFYSLMFAGLVQSFSGDFCDASEGDFYRPLACY